MRKFTIFGRTLEQIPTKMPKKEEKQAEEQKSKYADMPLEEIISDLEQQPEVTKLKDEIMRTRKKERKTYLIGTVIAIGTVAFMVPVFYYTFGKEGAATLPYSASATLVSLVNLFGAPLFRKRYKKKFLSYDNKIGKMMEEKVNDYDIWEKVDYYYKSHGRGYSELIWGVK